MEDLPQEIVQDLLKQTELLLTETRLGQIAKDNKSTSALLDHRTLYPIEDVYVRTKKSIQQEIDKRIHSRRGGRGERDIKPQAALVLEAFKEKGVHVDLLSGSYELEQQMWKNNCRRNATADKRRYKHPEIYQFLKSMDLRQKNAYKERVGSHLIQLAEELRDECRAMKSEMDLNGIFHPEANAHRVHCAYIMKLHKKITPENVDDFILHQMYAEHLLKQKSEEELAQKKEEMLQTLTQEEIANTKRRKEKEKLAAIASKTSEKREGSRGSPTNRKTSPPRAKTPSTPSRKDKSNSSSSSNLKDNRPTTSEKGKATLQRASSGVLDKVPLTLDKAPSQRRMSLSHIKSRESMMSANPLLPIAAEHSQEGTKESNSLTGSHPQHSSPDRRHAQQQKIFNKAYRPDKMGFMDSALILKEEASRFHAADTMFIRKPRDKNIILEEKISQWMLQGIQQQQIDKAATRSTSIIPHDKNIWSSSVTEKILQGNYSPTKVMPFDDYYQVLRDLHADEERSKLPPPPAPLRRGSSSQPIERVGSSASDANQPLHGADHPPRDNASTHTPSVVQPINLIKHFHEHDPNFEAYLKINELEQPSAKLFAKMNNATNKLIKPKRVRRIAPLGREAVNLVDSRGKESRLANKGFPNVFRVVGKKTRSTNKSSNKDEQNKDGDSDSTASSEHEEESALERLDEVELNDEETASYASNSEMGADMGFSPAATSPSTSEYKTPLQKHRSRRRLLRQQSTVGSSEGGGKKKGPLSASDMSSADAIIDDHLDDLLYPTQSPDVGEMDMQAKLNIAWDVLQYPTMERLAFMTKYSTQVYASEMPRAIDHWAEIAVYWAVFRQLLAIRQRGLVHAMNVNVAFARDTMTDIFRLVSPVLASKSPQLMPLSLFFYDHRTQPTETLPLSAQAVIDCRGKVKDFLFSILNSFNSKTNSNGNVTADNYAMLVKDMLKDFAHEMGGVLLFKLEALEMNLGDLVLWTGKPMRDWILAQEVMKI